MALIKCPECSGKVSTLAPACPHCGTPVSKIPSLDQERAEGVRAREQERPAEAEVDWQQPEEPPILLEMVLPPGQNSSPKEPLSSPLCPPPVSDIVRGQKVRAAIQPAVLQRTVEELRRSLVQQVLAQPTDLPDVDCIAAFRKEHAGLEEQSRQVQQRLQELSKAKEEYELLDAARREKSALVAAAEASLGQFVQALGKAAAAGVLAGKVEAQPLFDARVAVQRRIGELQVELRQLSPREDAGMVERAKAKTRQVLVAGQIKLEEMKIGRLEEEIGKELIGSNREESVRCDDTSETLAKVAKQRNVVIQYRQDANHARDALEKKKSEWGQLLEMTSIEGRNSFDVMQVCCQTQIEQIENQRIGLETELPGRLLACGPLDNQGRVGSLLISLRDAEAQLRMNGPAQQRQPLAVASASKPDGRWKAEETLGPGRKTGLGLSLIYYGIITTLVVVVPLIFGLNDLGDAARTNRSPAIGMMVLTVVSAVGFVVGNILLLIGPPLCLGASRESGCKEFLIGSIVLQWIGVFMIPLMFLRASSGGVFGLVSPLMSLASTALFVLFMKKLAAHLGWMEFASRAKRIVTGLTICGGLLLLGIAATLVAGPGGVALIADVIASVGSLAVFVMYANLVNDMRLASRSAQGQGARWR